MRFKIGKLSEYNRRTVFVVLAAIIGGLVATFYSPNLVLIILSLALLSRILSPIVSIKLFNSRFFRSIFYLFFYTILLQIVLLAGWLFTKDFSLDASVPLTFLLIVLVATLRPRHSLEPKESRLRTIRYTDIIAVGLAMLVALPMLSYTLTTSQTNLFNGFTKLSTGADDESHMKMFSAHVAYDRGIFYQLSDGRAANESAMYPVGWHSANAVIIKAIYPNMSPGNQAFIGYTFSKLFWFFTLLVVFCRAVMALSQCVVSKRLSPIASVWLILSIYIFSRFFVSDVYIAGAYSFVPQLIAALFATLLTVQLSENTTKDKHIVSTIFLITMVAIGGSLAWILALPALGITVAVLMILITKKGKSPSLIKDLITKPFYSVPLIILFGGSIAQLYVMLTHPTNGADSFLNAIKLDGGILINGPELYVFVTIGLVLSLTAINKTRPLLTRYLVWLVFPLLIYTQLISIYQVFQTGQNTYYYYKLLNLLTLLVLPLAIAGFAYALDWLHGKNMRILALTLLIGLSAFCGFLLIKTLLHIF